MESFISLSPDVSGGPPSPPPQQQPAAGSNAIGNGDFSRGGRLNGTNTGGTANGPAPVVTASGPAPVNTSPGIPVIMTTSTSTSTPTSTLMGDPLITNASAAGGGLTTDTQEEALKRSTAAVESLGQMDLLALVLDLMERVDAGSVTAKSVDNEVSEPLSCGEFCFNYFFKY